MKPASKQSSNISSSVIFPSFPETSQSKLGGVFCKVDCFEAGLVQPVFESPAMLVMLKMPMFLLHRLIPDSRGGFVKDFGKCWKAVEDQRSGELLINFGTKTENGGEGNEGGSKPKRSKAKRTSDGACKNR